MLEKKKKVLYILSLVFNIVILAFCIFGVLYCVHTMDNMQNAEIKEDDNAFYSAAILGFLNAMIFFGIVICAAVSIIVLIGILILIIKKTAYIYLIVVASFIAYSSIPLIASSIESVTKYNEPYTLVYITIPYFFFR